MASIATDIVVNLPQFGGGVSGSLLPLLMQVILGYTATHAGITNLPRGLASFLRKRAM